MGTFRFVHAADLHLDSPLRGLATEPGPLADRVRGATRAALVTLVDTALAEQVAFVLFAGDLFDGDWRDWRTGNFLTAQLLRLTRAGIRVVAIRGNHDALNVVTNNMALPEGATLLREDRPDTVAFDDLGAVIHGQSFAARAVTDNLARAYPAPAEGRFNIGLLHTAAGDTIHDNYAPCTVEQLAGHGYQYWALGHVHAGRVLHREPWVVFPGNLQGRHANETGPKGATLVTVRDGRVASAAPLILDAVRWERVMVDVTGADSDELVLQQVRRTLGTALDGAGGRLLAARLTLIGPTAAHAALTRNLSETRARLNAEAVALAGAEALWLEEIAVATRPAIDLEALRSRGDAVGRLARAIEAIDAAELSGGVRDYLSVLLDRSRGLREALPADHAARDGTVSAALIERARALLLARLAESS